MTPGTAGTIEVLKPGALTTVQDLGRRGALSSGVPLGGAMDRLAARVANWLVGNADTVPVLETTLAGPDLRFNGDTLIAVTGASFAGVAGWQPLLVRAGQEISLREVTMGCRGYLAVAGGFDIEVVMGGRGTYLRAGLGGFGGRALRKGDLLQIGPAEAKLVRKAEHWHIAPGVLPHYSERPTVRVTRGAQWAWFSQDTRSRFFEEPYVVLPNSDRMGLRLAGAKIVPTEPTEMKSEPVAFGSIQIPPDGQPIALMADCQTIGGYPRMGEAVSVDLPLLAQLRPGNRIQFAPVSLEEAQTLLVESERALAHLHEGLMDKLK